MARLVVIGRGRGIKTEDILVYTLGPTPLSLACPDRGLMKTHKANVLHYLEDKTPSSVASRVPPNSVWILDAMAILQSINLREIPKTFGELATLYLKKVDKNCQGELCKDGSSCYRPPVPSSQHQKCREGPQG